ncbi:hypothetical protein OF83DRAFT_807248 [Amylostereum chailletii]|nr:hypothetical protein OF83DRAFT_807248 [Amylostereum chailletii]
MSSSPRSSRSRRSSPRLDVPWKSLSKKTAHSSLSLVLAQAESGAPLPPATSHLPLLSMASDSSLKSESPTKEAEDLPREAEVAVDPPAKRGSQVVEDGPAGISVSAPTDGEPTTQTTPGASADVSCGRNASIGLADALERTQAQHQQGKPSQFVIRILHSKVIAIGRRAFNCLDIVWKISPVCWFGESQDVVSPRECLQPFAISWFIML